MPSSTVAYLRLNGLNLWDLKYKHILAALFTISGNQFQFITRYRISQKSLQFKPKLGMQFGDIVFNHLS